MSDYTTQDAIAAVSSGDVAGFKTAVNDILMNKVQDAVELKKLEVSGAFMSTGQEEPSIEGDTDD